jgi:LPXTG-site transpeptidase (sortase) family protein
MEVRFLSGIPRNLFMTRAETIRFLALRTLGNFLLLIALYGVVMTFGPGLMFEAQYQLIELRHVHFTIKEVAKVSEASKKNNILKTSGTSNSSGTSLKTPGFAAILAGNKEQVLTPIDPLFSILIPKLGIDEKVFPNVDPDNPHDYLPILQLGIAHAKGSVFPGESGTTYLFAHSADNWWDIEHYNAIFYTLNNLSAGDEITVFFENRRYEYVVSQQIISNPQDVSYLTAQHGGAQQLVLQTCWPPGTTFKRLYILAKPKESV